MRYHARLVTSFRGRRRIALGPFSFPCRARQGTIARHSACFRQSARYWRMRTALAAVAPLAFVIGCSQGDTAPPVATVTFSANKTRVPLGSPVELTYRFNV